MKKELLNESEIRKMMKFANLQPLTTPFIEKLEEGGYGGMAPKLKPIQQLPTPVNLASTWAPTLKPVRLNSLLQTWTWTWIWKLEAKTSHGI